MSVAIVCFGVWREVSRRPHRLEKLAVEADRDFRGSQAIKERTGQREAQCSASPFDNPTTSSYHELFGKL